MAFLNLCFVVISDLHLENMAAVAVVAPLPVIRASGAWQYGDPSLADVRLSLLDREQPSSGATRRKRASRQSWRLSWKQILTKPFQNQSRNRGVATNKKKRKGNVFVLNS